MEKQIRDLPYTINDQGEITNMNTGRVKEPTVDNCGYLRVLLWNSAIHKSEGAYVHQLVAENFLEPATDMVDPMLVFKDKNKRNCKADNLIYMERSQKLSAEHTDGGVYSKSTGDRKKVTVLIKDNEEIKFQSMSDAARYIAEKTGKSFPTVWTRIIRNDSYCGYRIIKL